MEKPEILNKVGKWKTYSENLRSVHDERWSKNLKLILGVNDAPHSKVRKRSKLFFRKIWATSWRLLASFYNAFLRDQDTFRFEGRDIQNDPLKAKVLQRLVEYRKDSLFRNQSLFIKIVWAFMNIIDYGWCVGKWTWVFDEESGEDTPKFILYPPEQVFPDLSAETKEEMRFIIFENYMSKEDMEDMDYENIDKAEPTGIPSNQLRHTRYNSEKDPLQNPGPNEYPRPGRYEGDDRKDSFEKIYRVWEVFYKEKNKIKLIVTNESKHVLKPTIDSPYGDKYKNIVMGQCLLRSNKLIGEGFPEPLEGPQESYNTTLNQRKDNVSLVMNRQTIVSRFGNVDLQSLVNSRPGNITLADDVGAVQDRDMQDVTQSAYMEAAIDESMMNEMSGITPGKMGMEQAEKATVAQINLSESNAKIDLYIAIVAETFVKDFYAGLAYLIAKFETDENIFRIANDKLREEVPTTKFYYDMDFEADLVLNVGMGTVGRSQEIQQTMLAIDRAIMSNQATAQLMSSGAQIPNAVFVNPAELFKDLLPLIGKKEFPRYFVPISQNQPWPGTAGNANAGRSQPQMGARQSLVSNGALEGAMRA